MTFVVARRMVEERVAGMLSKAQKNNAAEQCDRDDTLHRAERLGLDLEASFESVLLLSACE